MIARLLELALTNAVLAAGLAAIAWLIGRWCNRPQWMYGLWLLVLLKLVTPPLHSVPINIARHDQAEQAVANRSVLRPESSQESKSITTAPEQLPDFTSRSIQTEMPIFDSENSTPVSAAFAMLAADSTSEPLLESSESPSASAQSGAIPPAESWLSFLLASLSRLPLAELFAGAWFIGSAAWLTLVIVRSTRFARLLRQANPVPQWLTAEADTIARRLGISRLPQLRTVDSRISPLLWAVPGRACIVLPSQLIHEAPRSQVATLLAHELAHYRRGDHYCRWFELLVLSLFWWNPVAWWARRQLHRAEEECCDAWVLWALPKQSREYAGAILETLDYLSGAQPVMPALASGLGAADVLERRLTMILQGQLPRQLSLTSRLSLWLVAAVVLPLSATAQDAPSLVPSAGTAPAAENPADPKPVLAPVPASATAAPPSTDPFATPPVSAAPAAGLAPPATPAPPSIEPAGLPTATIRAENRLSETPLGVRAVTVEARHNDQSVEARLDRLERMIHDLAAAVGRGGGPRAAANFNPDGQAYPVPASRAVVYARSTSVGDMKKRRVDLEVQIDSMREQIDRLQQEMKKLDELIDSKSPAKDSDLKPTEPRQVR